MESTSIAPGVAGLILAGGRSSRMGSDKALLTLPGADSRTFAERLIALLGGVCEEILFVTRTETRDREDALFSPRARARVVYDQVPDQGPLMGLYSGLQAISCSHALVLAVDQPFVLPTLLTALRAFPLDDQIIVPRVQGIPQVLLARYPRVLLPLIADLLAGGRRDPRALLQSGARVHFWEEEQIRAVDPALRSFVNINTPEELRRARS